MVSLILAMITKVGDGYARVLQGFWASAKASGFRLPQKQPTAASAFCVARRKLGWRLFEELTRETASRLEEACGKDCRWKKRLVYAADGSKLSLPRSEALKTFGKPKRAARPMVHLVTVFNVFTRATITAAFGRYSSGERTLLSGVLNRIPKGSLLLLDRGYPGYPLFAQLISLGIDFVARVPKTGTFKEVMLFLKTGASSGQINIHSRRGGPPLRLRIVRKRRRDEDLVLLTTLQANEATPRELAQLYGHRWSIETSFKALKVDAFGENSLHSKTPDGIKQEIYARLLFLNLSSHLLIEAAHRTRVEADRIGPKAARVLLNQTQAVLVIVFGRHRITAWLSSCLEDIAMSRSERRKGRSFPRRSFRPRPRWDRVGKTTRRGH